MAVAITAAVIFFLPMQISKKVHSQYILACPVKGESIYRCPDSCRWEKFGIKSIALPINSYVITKNNSSLCLVFSKDLRITLNENTQMKIRYRHKRADNPVENIFLLARKQIKSLLSKDDFRLNTPTVLSTI